MIDFTCGESPGDQDVDDLIRALRQGFVADPTVLVAEGTNGEIMGVSAYQYRSFLDPRTNELIDGLEDAAYVVVIAVAAAYRGARLADRNGDTVGDVLLATTLREIASDKRGLVPAVWGLVERGNEPARLLLARHGFVIHVEGIAESPQDFKIRPPGLAVERAD